MRSGNQQLATGAIVVGAVTLAGLSLWWGEKKTELRKPRGRVKCPKETVVDPSTLRIGDYVILDLAATVGKFHELTWARVLGSTKTDLLEAKIVGEAGEFGRPKQISTRSHGFKLGDIVRFPPMCVLEIYRPIPKPGRVLCAGELPVEPRPDLKVDLLGSGDYVELVVQSREGEPEHLWVQIVDFGPQEQVLYGIVFSSPQQEDHGFNAGDEIVFLRDCIVDISFDVPPPVEPPAATE